ncbi:MAG TPA: hypothetical protein VKB50_00415 [Vicinamibacterales bacterium]|nr:hypothetical protein [Vicinamibacterales bacterium]
MSPRTILVRLGATTIACSVCTLVLAVQNDAIEWRVGPDITANDKKAIVELARNAGIDRPHRVAVSTTLAPGCHVLTVSSDVMVDGNRVTWTGLDLIRTDSKNCWPQRDSTKRVGRWMANTSRPWIEERSRIHDGDWHIDLELDDGVPYRDAERIVLAVRRKTLVNRVPGSQRADIDPDLITSIQKPTGKPAGEYIVTAGSGSRGVVFSIAIVDDRVELRGYRAASEI